MVAMTDRVNAFTVVLDKDFRLDDAQPILTALRMVRHVISVEAHVAGVTDHIATERARHELGQRVLDALYAGKGDT
jgi:hypothetical protein